MQPMKRALTMTGDRKINFSDKPFENVNDVKYDRYDLARSAYQIADILSRLPGDGEILSINAPWGASKSSLIGITTPLFGEGFPIDDELVCERYRPAHMDAAAFRDKIEQLRQSKIAFLDFNAWYEGDDGDIMHALLQDVAEKVSPSRNKMSNLVRRMSRAIQRHPQAIVREIVQVGAKALPFGGNFDLSKVLSDQDVIAKEIERTKVAVEAHRDAGERIVVVIDDIDRMSPDRVTALMKALWWIRQFPGLTFLLLMDEARVMDSLAFAMFPGATGGKELAARYLEKIVQYRFDIPQPTSEKLLDVLFVSLADRDSEKQDAGDNFREASKRPFFPDLSTDAVGRLTGRTAGGCTRGQIARLVLRDIVNTARVVVRLKNSLEVISGIHGDIAFDYLDMTVVEALRMADPVRFRDLQRRADLILSTQEVRLLDPVIFRVDQNLDDAARDELLHAFLMPAHHGVEVDGKVVRIERPFDVRDRRGFGDVMRGTFYLSNIPSDRNTLKFDTAAFFANRGKFDVIDLSPADRRKLHSVLHNEISERAAMEDQASRKAYRDTWTARLKDLSLMQ
jgi:hypothetical protein